MLHERPKSVQRPPSRRNHARHLFSAIAEEKRIDVAAPCVAIHASETATEEPRRSQLGGAQ